MAIKSIILPDIGTIQLCKRKGIKSLRLSIGHNGSVRVTLPPWLPYAIGAEFATRQRDWIMAKQTTTIPLLPNVRIGKTHKLIFAPEVGRTKTITRITSRGEIKIFHSSCLTSQDPSIQRAAEQASIRALKQQSEKLLILRLSALASKHGFEFRNVRVKQLKSRWGSCSSQRDITLNCFLIQLPWHLIDYVLLHELVHTQIMTHSSVFWAELETHIPHLKSVRKEIKSYQPVLLPV